MSRAKISNWVYVTGAPRSGTTFIGSILSTPLRVDYIHEPFNPDCGMPSVDQPFLYLRDEDSRLPKYMPDITALFEYRASLRTGYYPRDSRLKKFAKSIVGSRGSFYYRLARLNPFHNAAVIKDPIGCLLTSFLYRHFGVRPLIVLRHPVTFVASVLRLGWTPTLEPLLRQRELIEDYLQADLHELRSAGTDVVELAATQWKALHTVLLNQADQHSDWNVIRLEDVSENPVQRFRELYQYFDLPWSGHVERRVRRWTAPDNQAEVANGRVQQFRRDSRQIHALRAAMLEPQQRRRIFEITGERASRYYDEESYAI